MSSHVRTPQNPAQLSDFCFALKHVCDKIIDPPPYSQAESAETMTSPIQREHQIYDPLPLISSPPPPWW